MRLTSYLEEDEMRQNGRVRAHTHVWKTLENVITSNAHSLQFECWILFLKIILNRENWFTSAPAKSSKQFDFRIIVFLRCQGNTFDEIDVAAVVRLNPSIHGELQIGE